MQLSDLLDGVVDLRVAGLEEAEGAREVDCIVADHRAVSARSLFACVRGARLDGHGFANAAVAAGATALVVDHVVELDRHVPQIVVDDVRSVLGPLAARLAGHPSTRLTLVGITGTNGKTTVTHLLDAIARADGRVSGLLGTLGVRYAGRATATGFTTPEAPELQSIFADMVRERVEFVSMEVSSHALTQHRVDGTRFAAVAFTNLSPEHLDLHGDLDAYFEAKARLFDTVFADVAVVAVDDERGLRLAELARARGLDVTTVSAQGNEADFVAERVVVSVDGCRFEVADRAGAPGTKSRSFNVALLGRYNVANALVALAVARRLGVGEDSIEAGLLAAARVAGRLEPVENDTGVIVVVDYAHTPAALRTVLADVRELVPESARVIAVYGCGGDRDRTKRGPMGRAVAHGADIAVLTSDNPRSEAPEDIVADVLAGLGPNDERPLVVLDRADAIRRAIELAVPGDVVVIAGKGHETGQTADGVTIPFDDRAEAARVLGGASCA